MKLNTNFSEFKKKHQNNQNQVIFHKTDCKKNKAIENIINNFLEKKIVLYLSQSKKEE